MTKRYELPKGDLETYTNWFNAVTQGNNLDLEQLADLTGFGLTTIKAVKDGDSSLGERGSRWVADVCKGKDNHGNLPIDIEVLVKNHRSMFLPKVWERMYEFYGPELPEYVKPQQRYASQVYRKSRVKAQPPESVSEVQDRILNDLGKLVDLATTYTFYEVLGWLSTTELSADNKAALSEAMWNTRPSNDA